MGWFNHQLEIQYYNLSYPSKYGHVARALVTKDQGSKGDTKGGYNGGYNSYQGESYGNSGTLGP